jgi:transcriptional regulator with XRE-family HTH domain
LSIFNQDKENLKSELGDIVKYLRTKQGMTQEDLAQASSLNLSTISKIEQGVNDIALYTLLKLSKELSVDPGIIVSALNDFNEGNTKRALLSLQRKINKK